MQAFISGAIRGGIDRELPGREHAGDFRAGERQSRWNGDLKRDIVYRNDEMYNLMRSLDIGGQPDGLRYESDPGHRRR